MKVKFLAFGGINDSYEINGTVVNGIEINDFPDGGKFSGSEETKNAGIYHVERINGELHVTLAQCCTAYKCQPVNGSHDWAESDWIDASNYNPDTCYIIATPAPAGAEYHRTDDGWTVKIPEQEASNELV